MLDRKKYVSLDDANYTYLCAHHSFAGDPLLRELREATTALGDDSRMQVSEEQGAFLQVLTSAMGARRALELGTFTGYSALSIARGLPADGRLICLDASREWTDIARGFWKRAGVADKIDLRIGPALDSLAALNETEPFDLVFIDAKKEEYDAYFEAVLPRVRRGGLILLDNMLWGGRLARGDDRENSSKVLTGLNSKLAADPRVETVLLPIADGLQFCRVR